VPTKKKSLSPGRQEKEERRLDRRATRSVDWIDAKEEDACVDWIDKLTNPSLGRQEKNEECECRLDQRAEEQEAVAGTTGTNASIGLTSERVNELKKSVDRIDTRGCIDWINEKQKKAVAGTTQLTKKTVDWIDEPVEAWSSQQTRVNQQS